MPSSKNHVVTKRTKEHSALRSQGVRSMSAAELHLDMVAYGKKVASTRKSALEFLKLIGAPIKAASR